MKETPAKNTAERQTKKATTTRARGKTLVPAQLEVNTPPPPSQKSKAPDNAFARWAKEWDAKTAEMDSLIEADAKNALRIASERLDYSIELLFRLIEKKSLFIPCYRNDDTIDDHFSHDEAAECLKQRLLTIREKVSQYALAGDSAMIHAVWSLSRNFAETIHDIALDRPDRLEWLTMDSLFMPSLRAMPDNFRYDFPAIAKATRLSEECILDMRSKAAHRLDKPPTRFVANILQDVAFTIRSLGFEKRSLEHMRKSAARGLVEFLKYADMPLEKWLLECCYYKPYQIHYDELPPLTKKTVSEWWEKAIKGEVERRFEKIKGSKFYAILEAATASKKDYEVRDELKRRCKQALHSLARPDS